MSSSVQTINEQMIQKIEDTMMEAYQDETQLSLFKGVPIGDIGVEQWFHKNMKDLPEAALTLAGYNPQDVTLAAELFGNHVLTSAEEFQADEKVWAQWTKIGMDSKGIAMIGKKVAQTANKYLWLGEDSEGGQPILAYNFIKDAGAGDGTLNRPLIRTHATAGGWGTWLNISKDITRIFANLTNRGYNLGSTVLFYPEEAAYLMGLPGGGTQEVSAFDLIARRGVLALPVANRFMYTLAGADPTDILFDLYAIDLSTIDIGYTREERTRVIPPHDEVRYHKAEAEVWFVPYIVPKTWTDDKIYKGVSRITAIAP